ncbi:MAG: hypothetical protein KME26_13205 [Oscillatoria princeps RMCB-10]|nr:hypothetical protein [Oscillatoria princeps RMCB-10]
MPTFAENSPAPTPPKWQPVLLAQNPKLRISPETDAASRTPGAIAAH